MIVNVNMCVFMFDEIFYVMKFLVIVKKVRKYLKIVYFYILDFIWYVLLI